MTDVTALLVVGGALCGWIVLSLLGGERQRQLTVADVQRRKQERHDADAAARSHPGKPPA